MCSLGLWIYDLLQPQRGRRRTTSEVFWSTRYNTHLTKSPLNTPGRRSYPTGSYLYSSGLVSLTPPLHESWVVCVHRNGRTPPEWFRDIRPWAERVVRVYVRTCSCGQRPLPHLPCSGLHRHGDSGIPYVDSDLSLVQVPVLEQLPGVVSLSRN